MRRRRRLLIFLGAGALSGCFLTTGLDGFSGTPPTPNDDGGTSPAVESGSDNNIVAPLNDAGTDPNDGAAIDATFRCVNIVPTPTYCTDFDDGTVNTIIGAPTVTGGGVVTLDDQVFRSSGRSLRTSIPSFSFGPTARASVERRFQAAPLTSILIAFDLRVNSAAKASTNTLHIAMGGYTITTFIGETAAKVREGLPTDGGGPEYKTYDRLPPKVREWFRLSLMIKIAGAVPSDPSTATLAYDGVSTEGPIPIAIEKYRIPNWSVDIGLNFVDPPDLGRSLNIDNLVIDVK